MGLPGPYSLRYPPAELIGCWSQISGRSTFITEQFSLCYRHHRRTLLKCPVHDASLLAIQRLALCCLAEVRHGTASAYCRVYPHVRFGARQALSTSLDYATPLIL
jgi:hypothetical protein